MKKLVFSLHIAKVRVLFFYKSKAIFDTSWRGEFKL